MNLKHNIICWLLLLLLFQNYSNAQSTFDWFPLQPGTQYNYRVDSVAYISTVLKIDSTKLSGAQTLYHLNKIVHNCDTCKNQFLLNDPYDSTYVLNEQPQFLGHYFTVSAPNTIYFKGDQSFVLKVNTTVGNSWLFDTLAAITGTTISKQPQNIFGNADSICMIRLSTNDTIILSKRHGILQFPFSTPTSHKYLLVGIEGSSNEGQRFKYFHDFFNINPGDVFQYEFIDYDYNITPPLLKQGSEKWEFISVANYADSIVCQVRNTHVDSVKLAGNAPTIISYVQLIKQVFVDSASHFVNHLPGEEILASPYFLYANATNLFIHKTDISTDSQNRLVKSFGENCPHVYLTPGITGVAEETAFPHVFINRNTSRIIGRSATEGLGITSELYNDYSRIYQRCLVGSIKGTDTSGVIYQYPTGIHEPGQATDVQVFPNPANNNVTITGNFNEAVLVKITSLTGQELLAQIFLKQNKNYSLNVANIESGIYVVTVSNTQFIYTRKIIIQH